MFLEIPTIWFIIALFIMAIGTYFAASDSNDVKKIRVLSFN